MRSQTIVSGHILLTCMPGWGHLRPLCALAAKIVKERPDVAITLLIVGEYGQRMDREISRHFSDSEEMARAKANIRLVNMCGQGGLDVFALVPMLSQEFPDYYDKLVNCKPVRCLETNRIFEAIQKPTTVVLDFFLLPILQHIRSVTERSIPVFAWGSTYASFTLFMMGPEIFGGFGDVSAKARMQAEATGRKLEDIVNEIYNSSNGSLVNVPGLPAMYDYEWVPQGRTLTPGLDQNELYSSAYMFACECDGFVSVSSATYEPKSLEAMRTWLGETNRPVYAIGPLVPPGFGDTGLSDVAKQMEGLSSKNGADFRDFLDNMLESHGARSVIYVSFGSFCWPKRDERVWALVDALLELGFPFIFSHASPNAVIPAGYAEKINQSGIGLIAKWSPQQTILNHPATGWFLTHCGQNSVTEALAQGVPMIAWPLDADQPGNAAHLALNLDVAFELIEVRGVKPLCRGVQPTGTIEAIMAEARNILQQARGPEGERKRRNAESMRYKWRKEWEESGEALSNLRRFLTDISHND